jgi:hypothetical protein
VSDRGEIPTLPACYGFTRNSHRPSAPDTQHPHGILTPSPSVPASAKKLGSIAGAAFTNGPRSPFGACVGHTARIQIRVLVFARQAETGSI